MFIRSKASLATWNGLHDPKLTIDDAHAVVLGLPYDGATSYLKGARLAPQQIRKISTHIPPTREDGTSLQHLRILDLGDFKKGLRSQEQYFTAIREKARGLFARTFPTFIGGDHSVSIPLIMAAQDVWGKTLGLVHIDAHLDLCLEINGNRLSHGSVHRYVLNEKMTSLEQTVFIGIRSFEIQELNYLKEKKANIFRAASVAEIGIADVVEKTTSILACCKAVYLTFDIDFLDPAAAPGTGTPKPGGFSNRDALLLISRLCQRLPIIGMDVVEVSPPLDHNNITSFAAQRIITEAWGYTFN